MVQLDKAVVIVAGVPNAGSACRRVVVQGVIMRGCPLAPVRGPSQLAPRCENLHQTGLAGRLRAATLSDLGRHRTRLLSWDVSLRASPRDPEFAGQQSSDMGYVICCLDDQV